MLNNKFTTKQLMGLFGLFVMSLNTVMVSHAQASAWDDLSGFSEKVKEKGVNYSRPDRSDLTLRGASVSLRNDDSRVELLSRGGAAFKLDAPTLFSGYTQLKKKHDAGIPVDSPIGLVLLSQDKSAAMLKIDSATLKGLEQTSYLKGLDISAYSSMDLNSAPIVYADYDPMTSLGMISYTWLTRSSAGDVLISSQMFGPEDGGPDNCASPADCKPDTDPFGFAYTYGGNPFSAFEDKTNRGSHLFTDIEMDAFLAVVSGLTSSLKAQMALVSVEQVRTHDWKTTKKKSWGLKKKTTWHLEGYSKPVWFLVYPGQIRAENTTSYGFNTSKGEPFFYPASIVRVGDWSNLASIEKKFDYQKFSKTSWTSLAYALFAGLTFGAGAFVAPAFIAGTAFGSAATTVGTTFGFAAGSTGALVAGSGAVGFATSAVSNSISGSSLTDTPGQAFLGDGATRPAIPGRGLGNAWGSLAPEDMDDGVSGQGSYVNKGKDGKLDIRPTFVTKNFVNVKNGGDVRNAFNDSARSEFWKHGYDTSDGGVNSSAPVLLNSSPTLIRADKVDEATFDVAIGSFDNPFAQ